MSSQSNIEKVEYQDLTLIKGIGTTTKSKLNDAGIYTISQLKDMVPETLSEIKGLSVNSAVKIIDAANLILIYKDDGTISVKPEEIVDSMNIQIKDDKTLSTKKALVYVLPNAGFTALISFAANFMLLFYINIMGQPAIIAGVIYSISFILFALSSIIWGVIADRIGKKKVLGITSSILALTFVLLWIPPTPTTSQTYGQVYIPLIIWLIIFLFLFRITAAGFQSTLYALLPELSTNEKNRVKVSLLNTLMATLGFVVGIMGPVILMSQATMDLDRSTPQLYYPLSSIGRIIATQTFQFSIVIIIIFVIALILMQLIIKEQPKSNIGTLRMSEVLKSITIPFKDKNYKKWLITTFLFWIPFVSFQYLLINMATFMFKLRGSEFILLVGIALIAGIMSFFVWQILTIKIGLKKTLTICLSTAVVGFSLIALLVIPMDHLLLLIIGTIFVSIIACSLIGAMVFPLAITSNIIEKAEIKTGKSLGGTYYGTYSTIAALAAATAMLLVAIILQVLTTESPVAYGVIMGCNALLILIATIILQKIEL